MRNPFEFGRELQPGELVDREEEVRAVARTMCEAGKLFLIGPRRYGKTSVIHVAATRVEQENNAVVLRYDAEAHPRLDVLARRLVADAAKHLIGPVERAAERATRLFGRLRPQLSLNASDLTFSVILNVADGDATGTLPLVTDALDGIERLAAEAHRPVAVVLDEFQALVEAGGREAEGQLRSVMQRHAHVGYVMAGSKTHLLSAMTGDPSRPFYNMGQRWFLGPIPRDDFIASLRRGFLKAKATFTDDAIARVLDAAEEVPYNVQMLAHECWDWLFHQPLSRRHLTVSVVDQAVERIVRRHDGVYTQLWAQLAATQQTALTAFVREGSDGLLSARVAHTYEIATATMQTALGALREKTILRDEETMGTIRLRLSDPFFGAWVRLVTARG